MACRPTRLGRGAAHNQAPRGLGRILGVGVGAKECVHVYSMPQVEHSDVGRAGDLLVAFGQVVCPGPVTPRVSQWEANRQRAFAQMMQGVNNLDAMCSARHDTEPRRRMPVPGANNAYHCALPTASR